MSVGFLITVFWDRTLCSLCINFSRGGGGHAVSIFRVKTIYPEDGGSSFDTDCGYSKTGQWKTV